MAKKYRKPNEDITVLSKTIECFGNEYLNTWKVTKFPFEFIIVQKIHANIFSASISLIGAEPAWRGTNYTTINEALSAMQAQAKSFCEDIAWWRTI